MAPFLPIYAEMTSHAVAAHQQSGLVALSIAVAIVASYVALDLAQRSAGATGWPRRAWLTAGAVALGMGIWSMHFIGMLALKMAMPVSYDGGLVVLSMLAAVLGAALALAVVARPESGTRGLVCAAGFMGLAIAAMHYLGMASMEMGATIHWNVPLVALSLLIAYGASLAALYLVMQLGRRRFRLGFPRRALGAVVLGLGIAGLHYTAMAAATFETTTTGMHMSQGGLDADGLVVALSIGAGLMLAIMIGGGAADQRRAAIATDLALVASLARSLSGDGARTRACDAVRELTGADYVLLAEDGDDLEPLLTACSGDCEFAVGTASASVAPDPDAATIHREPLVLDGVTVGHFLVGYRRAHRRMGTRTASLLGMLTAEAALSIDRDDLIQRLDFMARRDELTGLFNRRVLRETLDEELERTARERGSLSLAILDLDSFKQVNDRLGHQAGDRLLKAAAAAWSAELGERGTIGRYGGDEFVVILPGLAGGAAATATERLRRAVPSEASCSAGVATWDGEQTAAQLIAAADAHLYEAKDGGRSRTASAPVA